MNRSFALLMAAMIGFGSFHAMAEDAASTTVPSAEHKGPHGGPGKFFEDADTNKDGFLTKDEMRSAQEKKLDEMFAKVDTDKDGKLSKEELKKGHEEMRAKMRARFQERKAAREAAEKEAAK